MKKALGILVLAAACGGGGGGDPDSRPPDPDAPPQPDAAPACTAITLMPTVFGGGGDTSIFWGAQINEDLSDPSPGTLQFEFYDGIRDLAGTTDLAAGVDANYATCAACLHAYTLNAAGDAIEREWFQSAGTMMLTESPFAAPEPSVRSMLGSLDGVTLVEVTIDPGSDPPFQSTPVDGGQCLTISTLALNDNDVPDTWTCAAAAWDDQTACDCVCGISDPDCSIGGATPTNGCGGGEVCFEDACVAPPPNDTCQTAALLVYGVPVTGTTVAATGNYDAGLEGAQCTGFTQAGPDVAYRLPPIVGTENITVTLSGIAATYDASVSLLGPGADTVCDANPISTCVAGADANLEGVDETFTFQTTAAGDYWIVVDSFYSGGPSSAGAFTLTVTLNP